MKDSLTSIKTTIRPLQRRVQLQLDPMTSNELSILNKRNKRFEDLLSETVRLEVGQGILPEKDVNKRLQELSKNRRINSLAVEAERTAGFARVSPEQKLRLVEALQARDQVVAMTGDGVNDAPALKQADIGVAMGRGGTEVAKEAADMVLTDDNFASIEAAVEEGRCVFDNLTKFIVWTLPTNMGEGLVLLTAIAVGAVLPILPVQILWINMTTAVALGLMLAFEPKEPGIMRRPPRDPGRAAARRAGRPGRDQIGDRLDCTRCRHD